MMIWHLGGGRGILRKVGGELNTRAAGWGPKGDRPARKIFRMPGKGCLPLSCAVIPGTVP